MSADLSFTGERFLPSCEGEIAYEHWHRYAFARRFVAGKRVLDAACGEGYGTAWLSDVATHACGVDIDVESIAHARREYGGRSRASFAACSCASLPFANASFDVVVSFETIEHLPASMQPPMLAEFARVLRPEGVLVLSSPNRVLYSEVREYRNEFHLHELDRDELDALLAPHFPLVQWARQRVQLASSIWAHGEGFEAWTVDDEGAAHYDGPDAMYFLVVASRRGTGADLPKLSLCVDAHDVELERAQSVARHALRLDRLLAEREASLSRHADHVLHLEKLVAEREAIVVERDAQLAQVNAVRESHERLIAMRDAEITARDARIGSQQAELAACRRALADRECALAAAHDEALRDAQQIEALDAECTRLSGAIDAQERIINFRQSFRWWLVLPWLRTRRALERMWP